MATLAEAAKGINCDASLLRCDGDDLEVALSEQEFEVGAAGLPLAAFNDAG